MSDSVDGGVDDQDDGGAGDPAPVVTAGSVTGVAQRPGTESLRPWWKAKPRPQYPNDWRKIVGGVGWTLITAGVLILLFVVYQLWGTGIQYASAQDDLATQFARRTAQIAVATTLPVATSTIATPPPTAVPSTENTVAASAPADPTLSAAPSEPVTAPTEAPTTAAAPVTATVPVAPYPGPPIQLGDVIGKVAIPKIGVNAYVLAGVRTQDIAKGVGHFPDTPLPGQQGNAALAGHRTTHGAVFGDLDKLVDGDEIKFTTLSGVTYTYVVNGSSVVEPNQVEVLADHPEKVMLTLATCTPKLTARQRLIVTAELKVGGEPPVQPATVQYGNPDLYANGADTGDTSTTLGPDDGATAAPGQTTAAGETAPGQTVATGQTGVTAAATTSTPTAATPASFGALNEGWFSDSQAYLPVILWGLALIALALLARALSRKTRRLIGWAVVLLPAIVLLYFWFENVNRLLPPNL